MPTPRADSTWLWSTRPIDISVTVIARRPVPRTVLWWNRTFEECETIPSHGASTEQSSTTLGSLCMENEMSIPCPKSLVNRDLAVADRHGAPADVDPVELGADHADVVEQDAVGFVHRDAVLTADHGDVAHGHVVRRDDDAAADDGPVLADELLRALEDERAHVGSGREPDGRRLRRPGDADHREQQTPARAAASAGPARPSSPPSSP